MILSTINDNKFTIYIVYNQEVEISDYNKKS